MKSIEFLEEHCEFNSPYDCYVILAICRKKDVEEITNSQEIVFRDVIKNKKDIIRKYNKLKCQAENFTENGKKYPFYMYVSMNARDGLKATFLLQNRINDWIQQTINGTDCSKQFKKIHSEFYSLLQKPKSRSKAQRYFMLDVDTKNKPLLRKINKIISDSKLSVLLRRETKNGYHIKLKPFDVRLFENISKEIPVTLCKDRNIFIEYISVTKKK